MSNIEDTSKQYSGYPPIVLGPDFGRKIEDMEAAGQKQLVNSDRLPSKLPRAEFEALGFTFGDPDKNDPLFMPATLPEGWRREASDHSMWSYLVDEHGRRRVSIFYKAAYYDRDAFASLDSLDSYVAHHVEYDGPLTITDEWATLETVTESAKRLRDRALGDAAKWGEYPASASTAKYIKQHTESAAKYSQLLETLGTGEES